MTTIPVNPGSNLPLAAQIACHFRQLIHGGGLREGDLLPSTGQIANASQPVVMKAYRQLQAEGLVKVRRTRGTVVTAGRSRQCLGILLRQSNPNGRPNAYLDSLVNGLMRRAVFHDQAPRVYVMNPQASTVEQMLPPAFLADLAHNHVGGLFVQPYQNDSTLIAWLLSHRLPYVLMGHEGPGPIVGPDNRRLLADGLRQLRKRDCRRLLVLSTFKEIKPADLLAELPNCETTAVDWQLCSVEGHTAAEAGRRLARQWLAAPAASRADGVVIPDDWLAVGFVMQLLAGGAKIPADLRVVVGCHRDQLQTVLADCDCLVLDPLEVVDRLIALLIQRLAAPEAPPESVLIPYQFLQELP